MHRTDAHQSKDSNTNHTADLRSRETLQVIDNDLVHSLQVGKDTDAQAFLGRLDNDREVGNMIDATSYFELEAEEYKQRGVVLTPELWLVKLMVGAIDPTYDEQVSPCNACFAVLSMLIERLADSCNTSATSGQ